MPPFSDRVHLHQAVRNQAVPVQEAIAANEKPRPLRRFESNDPPSFVSTTELEELSYADLVPPLRGHSMPQELIAIMERPIDDDELDSISHSMQSIVRPDNFYYTDAQRENFRLDRVPRPEMFRGINGSRRQGVIVRHAVKRRWEKLGVWNKKWGFAGRKMEPRDDFRKWTWWWQPEGAADDRKRAYDDRRELVARALRLRQNLRRGEHVPVLPRSRLGQDTTAAQAEAFLISRPWFVFQIEVAEEVTRYFRLSVEDRRRDPYLAKIQVIKWWKERGDWRQEFKRRNYGSSVTAWKWRHESPSPEPETLAPVDEIENSPLDAVKDMEFTASEIDEWETIDLPESEQPEGFWLIEDEDGPPYFPGQMKDTTARDRRHWDKMVRRHWAEQDKRAEIARAQGQPVDPLFGFQWGHLLRTPQAEERKESPPEEDEASTWSEEDASDPQRETACPPPQQRRRLRQRQHQQRDGVDADQTQDQPLPPPLRHSARIAGTKRPAEPLPSQTAPNKRPRGRAAPKKTE